LKTRFLGEVNTFFGNRFKTIKRVIYIIDRAKKTNDSKPLINLPNEIMKLIIESDDISDYLREVPRVIQFTTPLIQQQIESITNQTNSVRERAKLAFEFACDEIQHSFDSAACEVVTIGAEETIAKMEGICFAKSHVLASLLRGMHIPTGFCYQLKKDPKAGYALHGLNAIYLEETGWFRVDPRGNKEGIDSQFSIEVEQLAYPIDPSAGEVDYPGVYTEPLPEVIMAMQKSKDVQALFYNRPKAIESNKD